MNMEFDEEIREFLIESNENLALLDREIVLLEQRPDDENLISSAFRTIHTIKGTCGFFGFDLLGGVTHVTENILSQVRAQQRALTPELITLVLEATDQIKALLGRVEATGSEGEDDTAALREKLEQAYAACPSEVSEAPVWPSTSEAIAPPAITTAVEAPVRESEPSPVSSAARQAPTLLLAPNTKISVIEVGATRPTESRLEPTVEAPEKDGQLADSTIRVDVGLLNRLMNLVGELVLARNQLLQETAKCCPTENIATLKPYYQRAAGRSDEDPHATDWHGME